MKRVTCLIAAFAALVCSGCIPLSLHPLYADTDDYYDANLNGRWADPDGALTWEFAAVNDGPTYDVALVEDAEGTRSRFQARLVRIGAHTYMDLFPLLDEPTTPLHQLHMVPMHSIHKVEITATEFSLSFLQTEWLRQYVAEHPLEINFEVPEGYDVPVFTAETPRLQSFLLAIGMTHMLEAWDYPSTFTRYPEADE
jgi:hypothetical protein